ncbi:hypothetical protein LTR99_010408 [Exophiala xenobiotica]|nr:hypothetical protein LTR47_008934 [Exophiala xenobiotica]KAK5530271.1 hypothetical protein LTR23_010429 [Chaetothyriales sp. CCFEE 6169]KAK5244221.1 hypothetical protein LTS06_010174 [Exophiala xenobiotica]KAK5264118.1 hypothetical protein LTR96_010626 [Exophiala xenobiotica]KAK5282632.1 hypothetical protein LTR40_003028 [Exophiala xenobiotica]
MALKAALEKKDQELVLGLAERFGSRADKSMPDKENVGRRAEKVKEDLAILTRLSDSLDVMEENVTETRSAADSILSSLTNISEHIHYVRNVFERQPGAFNLSSIPMTVEDYFLQNLPTNFVLISWDPARWEIYDTKVVFSLARSYSQHGRSR